MKKKKVKLNSIKIFIHIIESNSAKTQLRISYITNKTTIEIIEGYLKKESPSFFKRWQVSFFFIFEFAIFFRKDIVN